MQDALHLCENPFIQSVSVDNVCSAYMTAKLLHMPNAVLYCEKKIQNDFSEISKLPDFLECNETEFRTLLQLIINKADNQFCSTGCIIDACIAWSKSKCIKEQVEIDDANVKNNLITSFNLIPFHKMGKQSFLKFNTDFPEFFSKEDLIKIITEKSNAFNELLQPIIYDCNRTIEINQRSEINQSGQESQTSIFGRYQRLNITENFTCNTDICIMKMAILNLVVETEHKHIAEIIFADSDGNILLANHRLPSV